MQRERIESLARAEGAPGTRRFDESNFAVGMRCRERLGGLRRSAFEKSERPEVRHAEEQGQVVDVVVPVAVSQAVLKPQLLQIRKTGDGLGPLAGLPITIKAAS